MGQTKKHRKKFALFLSLSLLCLWATVGTGVSLAWFTDTDTQTNHLFYFAQFDLEVKYRDKKGQYQVLEGTTEVFDKNALYEPGYVQVVYLQVTNKGDVPFVFKTAVSVTDYTEATNIFGEKFLLQDHLRFGIVSADTEANLEALLPDRDTAAPWADMELGQYSAPATRLEAEASIYIAVVVRMPEDVGDAANYRGEAIPRVVLGLTLRAEQDREGAMQ